MDEEKREAARKNRQELDRQAAEQAQAKKAEKEYMAKPGFGKEYFEAFGKTDF